MIIKKYINTLEQCFNGILISETFVNPKDAPDLYSLHT